ncbi:MAG: hypothetical protein IT287_08360 [Bdellovibrionaceae bacterium]|nr:hypothetical protein [Pseudobdellovibrionaceae bacterium]
MRLLAPFLLLLISYATGWAESTVDRSVLGKNFEILGPNCFSTAFRVTGLYATFRAVDEAEFRTYLKAFCQQVDQPQVGDIGTYSPPNYNFSHAYVLASDSTGIDKPGVDYKGKTSVSEKTLQSIDHVSYASPECRQYSDDVTQCANTRAFYRCQKPVFKDLAEIKKHNASVAAWDANVMVLLDTKMAISAQQAMYKKLESEFVVLQDQLQILLQLDIDTTHKEYFAARIASLKDQLIFIEISIRSHLTSNLYE